MCTSVSKKVPTTLGEILADELKTETSLYHRDEMLDAIPQGFKLLETDGDSNMELVTQYKGEDIAVGVGAMEAGCDRTRLRGGASGAMGHQLR